VVSLAILFRDIMSNKILKVTIKKEKKISNTDCAALETRINIIIIKFVSLFSALKIRTEKFFFI
jgi:hypothetical protein